MQRIDKWVKALAAHNSLLQTDGDMSRILIMLGLCRCIEAALAGMLTRHNFWQERRNDGPADTDQPGA